MLDTARRTARPRLRRSVMAKQRSKRPKPSVPPEELTVVVCRGGDCGSRRKHPDVDHGAQLPGCPLEHHFVPFPGETLEHRDRSQNRGPHVDVFGHRRLPSIERSELGHERARVMARNKGHVRIYGEAGTGRILGAEMLGPDVEHTAHLLAWAVQQGMTVGDALEMPFYHPVVEEGIRTALRDLRKNLRVARRNDMRCDDFEPGE